MKNILSAAVMVLAMLFAPAALSAQKGKMDTVQIKTSAECEMCKSKVEGEVGKMKGVKSVSVDLATKMVTVVYNSSKTNPDKIRTVISNAGYDADSVPANNRAKSKLPKCCQKPAGDSVPK